MTKTTETLRKFEYGDEVTLDGVANWRHPCRYLHDYHTGTVKAEDRFGQPLVSIDADRVSRV